MPNAKTPPIGWNCARQVLICATLIFSWRLTALSVQDFVIKLLVLLQFIVDSQRMEKILLILYSKHGFVINLVNILYLLLQTESNRPPDSVQTDWSDRGQVDDGETDKNASDNWNLSVRSKACIASGQNLSQALKMTFTCVQSTSVMKLLGVLGWISI